MRDLFYYPQETARMHVSQITALFLIRDKSDS